MASTLAAANQRYFDSIATSYDSKPWFTKTNQQVTDAIRSRLDWIGIPLANTGASDDAKEVKLLDYACGTGLMTRTLGPYVTQTRGIDISTKMVETFNSRTHDAGLSSETVHAVHGNLLDKSDPCPASFQAPEWENFDIATVGFGFHHFDDVVFAASQLRKRLRPGGVLVINDFLEGADVKADEQGNMMEGTQGNWTPGGHTHGHDHKHAHAHGKADSTHHAHDHAHFHHAHHKHDAQVEAEAVPQHDESDTSEFKQKMNASIVVPHFTIDGVKKFFAEAGFVDVDVVPLGEKSYMEFGGQKLWRTILIARGRVPESE